MNEKPGLEPGFFARRAAGGLTGYAFLNGRGRTMPKSQTNYDLRQAGHDDQLVGWVEPFAKPIEA